jgi:metal-dependent HD superfamily phosphatase/phosphodiesterase
MIGIKDVKNDSEVRAIMQIAETQIEALGFTEHSTRHSSIVSKWAGDILRKIGASEREVNLAEIAGYLHDLGNSISRYEHAQSGALLAYNILTRMGMDYLSASEVMMAIGNHDEENGVPVSKISAALIIADKADVHKSRVRKEVVRVGADSIHDRVNLAAESSFVTVNNDDKSISIEIVINNEMCEVLDYFEIYHKRIQLCRRASNFLGYKFGLKINGNTLI